MKEPVDQAHLDASLYPQHQASKGSFALLLTCLSLYCSSLEQNSHSASRAFSLFLLRHSALLPPLIPGSGAGDQVITIFTVRNVSTPSNSEPHRAITVHEKATREGPIPHEGRLLGMLSNHLLGTRLLLSRDHRMTMSLENFCRTVTET